MNDSCNLSLISVDDVVCFGDTNGVITVTADSGSGSYHYYLEVFNSNFPPLCQSPVLGSFVISSGFVSF